MANLANFAYDPINYEHFRKLNILDIFLDVLVEEKDDVMIEFAMGGICNCCLDKLNAEFLTENDAVKIMLPHLSSANQETVLSTITALIYLMSPQTKQGNCLYSGLFPTTLCHHKQSKVTASLVGYFLLPHVTTNKAR